MFTFTGKDKDECVAFVREIRLKAFAEGKEADPNWMVRLAFPCFAGTALVWHSSLPKETRNDWWRLERAILVDFPDFTSPSLAISPGRIPIQDWYTPIPPSDHLLSIRSYDDRLLQARARRKLYQGAGDESLACWLLIENLQDVPRNAIRTGTDKGGSPLFSVRTWYRDAGITIGRYGPHLSG